MRAPMLTAWAGGPKADRLQGRGKAFLVAGYFMHLISERKMVYGILVFTAFFFVGLMFLTVWSFADFPPLTVKH